MALSKSVKNAIKLGTLCTISYFAVYVARNVLSAITPRLLLIGYTENFIAKLSSLYFIAYAIGQLINGVIGDRIKAKYMLSFGLLFAGLFQLALPFVLKTPFLSVLSYSLTGFCLSMIYAPMTKVVAENNDLFLTSRISLGYTFSSFFGSPVAGLLATFFAWQTVFYTSSAFLIIMAILVMTIFIRFEKTGIVKYKERKEIQKSNASVKVLFSRQIIKFSLVSIITGIVRTSVVFWLPTYINKYLCFSAEKSTLLFTIVSLLLCVNGFLAIFVYEKLKNGLSLSLFLFFLVSAIFFFLTYLINAPVFNLIFIVIAIICSNSASSLMWSIYCPSLSDTGLVSSATGYLDFLSYIAAAGANVFFADASTTLGWKSLILVWFVLIVFGIIVSLPLRKKPKTI